MDKTTIRGRLARVVLESDSKAGRLYNLVVFGAILLSVVGLMFEPAPLLPGSVQVAVPAWVDLIDRIALAVFAADLALHLMASPRPLAYLRSFYGLIDLCAVLFFAVPQISSGLVLWVFKFGRILRVFKLLRFMDEARALGAALRASARRITVFILFVLILQVVLGYVMVVVESVHPESQFRSDFGYQYDSISDRPASFSLCWDNNDSWGGGMLSKFSLIAEAYECFIKQPAVS